MKTTRNLFLLSGERETVKYVLDKLSFKGLVTASLGTMVDNNYLDRALVEIKVPYAMHVIMSWTMIFRERCREDGSTGLLCPRLIIQLNSSFLWVRKNLLKNSLLVL